MAGGNKKKRKPAPNPARGFATTSTPSKAVNGQTDEVSSTEASGVVTPATGNDSVSVEAPIERSVEDLSPEEFEAQLEISELQAFVETSSSKVKKDAARHITRLETDRRVLRGQADFLSVKHWLPEELILEILETINDISEHHLPVQRSRSLQEDDLTKKIWTLRRILLELDFPFVRVNEVLIHLLQHPPLEDSTSQVWGLDESLDWLALQCTEEELREYDAARKIVQSAPDDDLDDAEPYQNGIGEGSMGKQKPSASSKESVTSLRTDAVDDLEVSDLESDLEPDELLSEYLRTRARMYEIDPLETLIAKTKHTKSRSRQLDLANASSAGYEKLLQKLERISSDVLFDQQDADMQWAKQKASLAQMAAQRRKLNLRTGEDIENPGDPSRVTSIPKDQPSRSFKDQEDDDLLGGMFDALPALPVPRNDDATKSTSSVVLRDFGRLTGVNPKRILEETCRSRDARCKIWYEQVSPTTYACRHACYVEWTRGQDISDSSHTTAVIVQQKRNSLKITMQEEATPDANQSEAYVATAALFLIFAGSPKEERSHLRLPPAFRDLWNEFATSRREVADAADRDTVKELREVVRREMRVEELEDDEVVFDVSSRNKANGLWNESSTPASRSRTPVSTSGQPGFSQVLQDIWTKKASTSAYQKMLPARMNLPMFDSKELVLETVGKNTITIIVGETGSGKSTQMPQYILENEMSKGRPCKIYCTEPRRISAISLAQRVSEELGEHPNDLGTLRSLVGYAIRLESHTTAQTRLVFATVGIVLRMLENLDGLDEVTHLIIDEVHERSIDTDFLLIVIQSLMQRRPDLKILLMSATMNAERLSQYFQGAPVITVPGRTFSVRAMFLEDAIECTGYSISNSNGEQELGEDEAETDREEHSNTLRYLKGYDRKTVSMLANYDEYAIDYGLIIRLLELVAYNNVYQEFSKAVLIFLPGIAEIRRLHDMLSSHSLFVRGWKVHALHSTFSSEDQQAAFELPPHGIRKIVIATNIAETGITIPDITCVIDTGKHREMRFDERRQMSRLTQSFIARSNAKQRRGRAGRVQEGICWHLFTRCRFEELMSEQQTPEMLRLSLQDLVLRVKISKLGGIEDTLSQALDPPSSKTVRRSIDALIEVDALNKDESLTALGTQIAKLPLDAQLGKLILFAACYSCLDFGLTIAAALTSKSPFVVPYSAKKQADSVRLGFKRGDSDLLTLYNAYKAWKNVCITPRLSEYHFCNKNFLSSQNLANIEDLKRQLLMSLVDSGFITMDPEQKSALLRDKPGHGRRSFVSVPERYCSADDNEAIISSVVAWSFYPKIIKRDGKGWRNIANSQTLSLHPTSVSKTSLSPDVQYLSFHSVMQSSTKFTNAQETTPVSDFALVLMAGDAVFHMYAGVIVIDGNRLRFKVRDWKTMIVLKVLREKIKQALARQFKYQGKELGERQKHWMELIGRIFESRNA